MKRGLEFSLESEENCEEEEFLPRRNYTPALQNPRPGRY